MNDSEIHRIRLIDVKPQPWKNGGGVTRELLAWPNAADWMLRVSVADIERDGPFSSFPGVQRHFAVLDGSGVELEGVGEIRKGDAPAMFEGDKARECRLLDGSTRDLNLMVRRDFGNGLLRLEDQGDLVMAHGATIHGLFDASNGTLCWVDGKRALSVDSKQAQSGSLFHFAFWTTEALQWAAANP